MSPAATPGHVLLSFHAEPAAWYDIQSSSDLEHWQPYGRRVSGLLDMQYEETASATGPPQFFRLRYVSYSEPEDMYIPNQEFEAPVLGDNGITTSVPNWTTTGGSGVWNPPASIYPDEIMEGQNVAYVHNGHRLSQQLTDVLEPYRIYVLDAIVGKRPDIGFPTGAPPNLILRAGGVDLVPFESESPSLLPGQLEPWWRKFRIGGDHPQLGQALEIVLDGGASGVISQVNFDTVILEIE
jgi:hypothetical protein